MSVEARMTTKARDSLHRIYGSTVQRFNTAQLFVIPLVRHSLERRRVLCHSYSNLNAPEKSISPR